MRAPLGVLGLVALAGCSHPPTTMAIDVQLGAGVTAPPSMMVSVYDAHRALTLARSIEHAPPGRVVLILPDLAQPVRAVVAAGSLLAGARIDTRPFEEVRATVTLRADTADTDVDGVPDELDDCPTVRDPDQRSTSGEVGDACAGFDAGADAGPDDLAPPDLGPPPDMTPAVVFFDDFNGAGVDTSLWTPMTTGGGTIGQANGMLTLTVPTATSAGADIESGILFNTGTTVEMSVSVTAGQVFDHHLLGYADWPVYNDCFSGETEAAAFRGQDQDRYVEAKTNDTPNCVLEEQSYPAGPHLLRVVRPAGGGPVQFFDNGALVGTLATMVPAGPLPVRFSLWTYTNSPPAAPVTLQIDYVKVTIP